MKKVKLNRELSGAQLQRLGQKVRLGGRSWLLRRHRLVSGLILVVGLAAVLGGMLFMLLVEPVVLSDNATVPILDVDTMDQLELWIEDRHNAATGGLTVPSNVW